MGRTDCWQEESHGKGANVTMPLSGMGKTATEAQDFVPSLGRRRVSPQILTV